MGCFERVAAIKRAAFALLAGGILVVSAASGAWASAGCDAVNNGELDVSASTSTPMAWRTITGKRFSPGDVLTTTSRTNDGTLNYVYLVFSDGSQRRAEKNNPTNYSTFTLTAAGNESTITAYIYNGGSGGASNWITVACTPGPANASLTEIQASPNPSTAGQSVSFTTTVTGTASNGVPNGTVTINFGDGTSTPVTLSGGTATTTHTYATAGSKSVTANYSGDGTNYVASSGSLTQTVNKAPTTTSFNASPAPSAAGQQVTFSATVSSTAGTPTGTVTFNFGDGTSQSAATLAGGAASVTHTYATAGNFSVTATYSSDANFLGSSQVVSQSVGQATSGTTVASSANPIPFGQSVSFTATVTGVNPTGTASFFDGATLIGSVALSSGQATLTTSALTPGGHSITAVYSGDSNNNGSTSSVLSQTISLSTTTTTLASSQNPSEAGKPVTFTATVTSGAGAPTAGTVTFMDGATTLGTVALSGGVASLTTAALTLGSHTITASFSGSPGFTSGASSPLVQSVNIPADSLKLRALQALATPMVSQFSGQAISGAIDNAITEGFADGSGSLVAPNNSGIRFNFSAESRDDDSQAAPKVSSAAPFGNAGPSQTSSRVEDAFGALAYAAPIKAPTRFSEPRDWLGWAEVRGATLDRWSSSGTGSVSTLYGNQINALAGLTRKLAPNFLIGAFGGYETFEYRSDQLQGRLKGDGWTVGSYLGWKITQTIRFDAAVGYSGLGYDGTAGTASGTFNGNRWLVSGGLTGTYESHGLQIEPSARIYALWEHENAYTDTLGTLQSARDFSTGRASGGLKLAYPVMWSSVAIAPYVGLYGDYYFNSDSAAVPAASLATVSAAILDGWSARIASGANLKFANGAQISVGAERGGIGSSSGAALWTYRARASVPF
ncbi:MAG: Ig-like domain repeat protein [Afipia sp.]